MNSLKNWLFNLYVNNIFKIYYTLHQKTSWKLKKLIIKPYIAVTKLHYYNFNPSEYIFNSIQIQTQTYCNLNCQFCPNNKIKRDHGTMTLDLYNDIINQLSRLEYSGEIALYLHSEPLLDKRISRLIKIARDKCPNSIITLFSNGTLLTNKLMEEIFNSGLSYLRINDYTMVQANNNKTAESYDIKSKITSFKSYPLLREKIKIYTYFPNIQNMSNRSGLMEGIRVPTPLKLFCNRPFEQMYINFKGETLFCCNDWQFTEKMGDLTKHSLIEIWGNKKYENLRNHLLKNKRRRICFNCDYASVLFPKVIFLSFINKVLPFKISLK